MEDPTFPLDTPEVFGGLKTWLFEGPEYIGSFWVLKTRQTQVEIATPLPPLSPSWASDNEKTRAVARQGPWFGAPPGAGGPRSALAPWAVQMLGGFGLQAMG